jgi:Cof subfamily protein (haloacid dehalogenase superfamily)
MKKIIALDIDGTLLTSTKEVTENTKNILHRLHQEGHHLVICSGRSNEAIKDLIKQLDLWGAFEYIVAFNGAIVENIKTGELVVEQRLLLDDVKMLFDKSYDYDSEVIVYYNKSIMSKTERVHNYSTVRKRGFTTEYIKDSSRIKVAPYKFLYVDEKEVLDRIEPTIKESFNSKFAIARSGPSFLDISPFGIDKGKSILKVAALLNTPIEDVIAFGDSSNDFEMIEAAGVGVAMANSTQDILDIADEVTLSNDEDGIVHYINQHILK